VNITKAGLILAFVLGLTDIAILAALGGSGAKPPMPVVIVSVAIGAASVVLVGLAWRRPTRALIGGTIILRALSTASDFAAFNQDAAIVVMSIVFIIANVTCMYLLRAGLRKPDPALSSAPTP
jgi:hypothetical protein